MFRILESTTFDEIKDFCCNQWALRSVNYTLYDDSFNNLDTCSNLTVNEVFSYYNQTDTTFYPGVCFYLIDKLKNQTELLKSNIEAIEAKGSTVNENDEGNNKMTYELDRCLKYMRDGKMLKGLSVYF
jgi:hypothetical protein